LCIHNATYC